MFTSYFSKSHLLFPSCGYSLYYVLKQLSFTYFTLDSTFPSSVGVYTSQCKPRESLWGVPATTPLADLLSPQTDGMPVILKIQV